MYIEPNYKFLAMVAHIRLIQGWSVKKVSDYIGYLNAEDLQPKHTKQ